MTIRDDELRAHFEDLSATDAAASPAFDPPLDARRSAGAGWPRRWRLGAAATIVIAAALLSLVSLIARRARAHRRPDVVQIDPSILRWSSPTDGLLRAARQLTSTTPGGL